MARVLRCHFCNWLNRRRCPVSEGAANALGSMPPWGWALLLLGSGGAGTLSGLSLESHENCAERSEVLALEGDLEGDRVALDSANATIQSLIDVIKDQKNQSGWIE